MSARDVVISHEVKAEWNGIRCAVRGGSVKRNNDKHDVGTTETGKNRPHAVGVGHWDISLDFFMDRAVDPVVLFGLDPEDGYIDEIKLYVYGIDNNPITLRDIACENPFAQTFQYGNPSTWSMSGSSADVDFAGI